MKQMNNKLHVYTGNGKGKTTAAMGLAVRSAGHGRRVLIAQFLKDGRSGELNAFKMLPSVEVYPMKPVSGFVFAMNEEEKRQTEKEQRAQALALRTHIEQSRPELIVLDELNVALSTGMLDRETADALLETALQCGDTVATGRNAPEWLIQRADYVSEICAEKHPFQTEGLKARAGIEY